VNRWHALLDEYSALGPWMPHARPPTRSRRWAHLAAERNSTASQRGAPVTLTESLDDPVVRYDGIWVAGLDAAQWPPHPRPDVFIPLQLQVAAGIPWASAAAQIRSAGLSLAGSAAATEHLVCSWARLEGEAQRSPSPLLKAARSSRVEYVTARASCVPHQRRCIAGIIESIEDVTGRRRGHHPARCAGGVKSLNAAGRCGFRAYGSFRLSAEPLESPAPGSTIAERGICCTRRSSWSGSSSARTSSLTATDAQVSTRADDRRLGWRGSRGFGLSAVTEPPSCGWPSTAERTGIEKLIEFLLEEERKRAPFRRGKARSSREVHIAGGTFELRIDRIDSSKAAATPSSTTKSGAPAHWWQGRTVRDPQALGYLMAERSRNVLALANVSLANGRAKILRQGAHKRLLPGVNGLPGMEPTKVPPGEIAAAWQWQTRALAARLQQLARGYHRGAAPSSRRPRVPQLHLTTLCRRVELAALDCARRPR
jgi:hypothetical protein